MTMYAGDGVDQKGSGNLIRRLMGIKAPRPHGARAVVCVCVGARVRIRAYAWRVCACAGARVCVRARVQ